jgi:hypothetical protein
MSGSYDPIQKELNLLNVISAPGQFDAVSIFNPGNLLKDTQLMYILIK